MPGDALKKITPLKAAAQLCIPSGERVHIFARRHPDEAPEVASEMTLIREAGIGGCLGDWRPRAEQILGMRNANLEHLCGTRQLLETPDETTLRVKLPPTFAIRWLVPRLARFLALDRHIDVQITTSHQRVDFDREDADACIHSGNMPPLDAASRRLFGEILLPVAVRVY